MTCQSAALTEAARTRTSTCPGAARGRSTSSSRSESGEPYSCWTIAFIAAPRMLTGCHRER